MWKKIIIKFYFYCTKIRALLRTSLMFLWELKNAIISQNLRGLCDIKTNTKNPHTVASTSSATVLFNTTHAALACWRHVLIPPCDFDSAQSPYYLLLHSVPERSRRHILNSHLGAWACRRHILNSHLGAWA